MAHVQRITYIYDPDLVLLCDSVPVLKNRASIVHALIHSYDLTSRLAVVPSTEASSDDIRAFHSEDYVQYIQNTDSDNENDDSFGLGFDCPSLHNMWQMVKIIAGSSLRAANALIDGRSSVSINWCGGWHHAERDSASGFCYVNDIVLAIQRLRKKFDKILYVDLDVHHGDGVENAFSFSRKVITFSLHKLEPGFFPGTGKVEDVGLGKGKFYTVNAPYKDGITDFQLSYLFERVLHDITAVFEPDAVVCQCGADTLSQDPLGGANVSLDGYLNLIKQIQKLKKPSLYLGGGGYNKPNTAKLWTAITFTLLNEIVPDEIPEHKYFPLYGPDFTLNVESGLRKSENTQQYLDEVIGTIKGNLENLNNSDSGRKPS